MPNISETSVSDISLSPACSVMIIFFLESYWEAQRCLRITVAARAQALERRGGRLGSLSVRCWSIHLRFTPLHLLLAGQTARPWCNSSADWG